MTLSGGGSGSLASISSGGRRLAISWPQRLPAPVLAGSVATYPEVVPGVDLQVVTDADRFSTLLVVKSRQAASNPALASIKFPVATQGLTMRSDAATGVVTAVDESGKAVFDGGTPMMWDSTGGGEISAAAAAGAAPRERRSRQMQTRLGRDYVELVPDAAMLADSATVFPVVIDPTWGRSRNNWTLLRRTFPNSAFWNITSTGPNDATSGAVKTGYSTDANGNYSDRSVFEFDISGVRGTSVSSATFSLRQLWTWQNCGGAAGRATRLFETPGINSATTWNVGWNTSGSGWNDQLGANSDVRRYNGSGNCAAATVNFDVTGRMQQKAAAGASTITLGLKSDSDLNDLTGHRRYDLNSVYLSVIYNSYPGKPDALRTDEKACSASRSVVNGGMLSAQVSDPDGGNVSASFQVQRQISGTWGASTSVGPVSVTSQQRAQVAAPGLVDGGIYRWQVRTADPAGLSGPWSEWCEFSVDMTPPAPPGRVASLDFPPDTIAGGVGRSGTFTIDKPVVGAADVAGYVWALTPLTTPPTDGTRTVAAATAGTNTTVAITPTVEGSNTLRAWSIDAAGNISDINSPREYSFTIGSGTDPVSWYPMDEAVGPVLFDHGSNGANASLQGNATPGGGVTALGGGTGYAASSGPVVNTAGSFSVAAWVYKPSGDSGWHSIVAQDGGTQAGFTITWQGTWRFHTYGSNAIGAPIYEIAAPSAALDVWTHLVAVYDAASTTMSFYVNGAIVGTRIRPSAWNATGPLMIGRTRYDTVYKDYLRGSVDDVRVWDRVVSSDEVAAVVGETHNVGLWALDDGPGTSTAADWSGMSPARDATFGGGRASVGGHDSTDFSDLAVRFDGTSGYASTNGPVVRTDESFTVAAWVTKAPGGNDWQSVISQDAARCVGFALTWHIDRWTVQTYSADVNGPAIYAAAASQPAAVNVWTHLAVVYDAAAGQLHLYVNGTLSATTTRPRTWHAGGPLMIGRSRYDGLLKDYFTGTIDDVYAYTGARSQADIQQLMQST
jgi:hypothetical protein